MLQLDEQIRAAFEHGAHLAISVSGGKDSDAMAHLLTDLWQQEGYTGTIQLIHADLGRAEHWQTPAYIESLSERLNLPLHVVRHSKYDLLDGIRHRMATRPDVPPWPSAATRQCTSDWKRGPISKWLRNQFPTGTVVCAMGIRADESPARSRKRPVELREDCCAAHRTVYNWLPIFHHTEAQVWQTLEGHPHHPMYDRGNERLSCCLCVLASSNDLINGIENDPELFVEYCRIEMESGYSFRQNLWLGTLHPDLLPPDLLEWYTEKGVLATLEQLAQTRTQLTLWTDVEV